ncbi:MAG: Mur ligase family protein [bacterium]
MNESNIVFGLERIKRVLSYFDNPQDKLKIIHVAGTNAKGSICFILGSMLKSFGYTVGIYSSPHINSINERFMIGNKLINDSDLDYYGMKVFLASRKLGVPLTYFEILTAVSFLYFLEKKTEYVLLETGLGGRLDATNVIKKPELVIIPTIARDHLNYLGNSIKKIAIEKGAIIKSGSPVVIGSMPLSAGKIVNLRVRQKKTKLYSLGKEFGIKKAYAQIKERSYKFNYCGIRQSTQDLVWMGINKAALKNVPISLASCELLLGNEFNIEKALKNKPDYLSGRTDVVNVSKNGKGYLSVFDGAHNTQAIMNLADSVSLFFKDYKKIFILNFMKDKEFKKNINIILPFANEILIKGINSPRALRQEEVFEYIKRISPNFNARIVDSAAEIFRSNKNNNVFIFCGSFYLIGEMIKELENEGWAISRG